MTEGDLRQSERLLWIGGDLVPAPAGSVGARFIQESGRKRVIPKSGKCVVDRLMVIQVCGAHGAVIVRRGNGYPVNGERSQILLSQVRVHAAVVLHFGVRRGIERVVEANIGDIIQPTAYAGVGRADIARVVRAGHGRKRRTDIESLSWYLVAVLAFHKARIRTGLIDERCRVHSFAGKCEQVIGNGSCPALRIELRSLVPSIRGNNRTFPNRFIRKEPEEVVLPEGAAYAASKLVEALRILQQSPLRRSARLLGCRSVPALIRVQPGAVDLEKEAAMQLIGTVLGDNLNIRPAEAALGSIVAGRDDVHILHGIFIRSNDRRTTPHRTDSADAVDTYTVRLVLSPR